MDNLSTLKSADLYECAYYLSNGCTVRNIEIIEENKKELCFLFMTGEQILSLQQNYFKSEAIINLFEFRRSYSRLMNLIALAKKEARQQQASLKQGGNS